jgi:predicted DNA-binding protein (UPF0278 family)
MKGKANTKDKHINPTSNNLGQRKITKKLQTNKEKREESPNYNLPTLRKKQPRNTNTMNTEEPTNTKLPKINLFVNKTKNITNVKVKNINNITNLYLDSKKRISVVETEEDGSSIYTAEEKLANYLARLLCGYDSCCAITIDADSQGSQKKIFIATNHIHEIQKKPNKYNIYKKDKIEEKEKKENQQTVLMKSVLEEIKKGINVNDPNSYVNIKKSLYMNLIHVRHYTYFIPYKTLCEKTMLDYLEWFFTGKNPKPFSEMIHPAFATPEIQEIIDKHINAFNKIKDSAINRGNFDYEIIKIEKYNVHAEIKMIKYLREKYKNQKSDKTLYIGTSLNCCWDCNYLLSNHFKTNNNVNFKVRRCSNHLFNYVLPNCITMTTTDKIKYKKERQIQKTKSKTNPLPTDSKTPTKTEYAKLGESEVSRFGISSKMNDAIKEKFTCYNKNTGEATIIQSIVEEIIKKNNKKEVEICKRVLSRSLEKLDKIKK